MSETAAPEALTPVPLTDEAILERFQRTKNQPTGSQTLGFRIVAVSQATKTVEVEFDARAVEVPTQSTAGASFHGKGSDGTSRFVIDEGKRVLVGATFVGSDVAEWLHAATIAVVAEVSLEDLWHAVPAFPTRSEVWLKLLEAYGL